MQPDSILQSDVLDLIFEQRNKDYGAYTLRKFYNNRLYKALGLVFIACSGLSILILTHKVTKRSFLVPDIETVYYQVPLNEPLKKKETLKTPEKPRLPVPVKKVNTQTFVAKVKIVDNGAISSKLPQNLDSAVISNITGAGLPGNKPLVKAPSAPLQPGTGVNIHPVTPDKNKPLASAEVMPSYPGGMDALRAFLERNLTNPEDMAQGEMVSVKIKFIVGYDGGLKGFEIEEDGGNTYNNEVIRVLKKMPRWIPGKTGGENVSVYYSIPVKFMAPE